MRCDPLYLNSVRESYSRNDRGAGIKLSYIRIELMSCLCEAQGLIPSTDIKGGQGCGSMVEHLSCICDALDLIPGMAAGESDL